MYLNILAVLLWSVTLWDNVNCNTETNVAQQKMNACEPGSVFTRDCNQCQCSADGRHASCTLKICHLQSAGKEKFTNEAAAEGCVPTTSVEGECHRCICGHDGTYYCHNIKCKQNKDTHLRRSMNTEITLGQSCIPGKVYYLECNSCICHENNALMCSQMACVPASWVAKLKAMHQGPKRQKLRRPKRKAETKKPKQVPTRTTRMSTTTEYPSLPNGQCVPGQIYKHLCKMCYCTINRNASCVPATCDGTSLRTSILGPEDISPTLTTEEFDMLPTLPHSAAECDAGRAYRVDCNSCLCMVDRNMLCSKKLCPSYDEVNKRQAKKQSGENCKKGDIVDSKCITCVCVNDVLTCDAVPGCISEVLDLRSFHGNVLKTSNHRSLDIDKEKCVKGIIYKQDCNKCYCIKDGMLRCTSKVCLQYTEVKRLQKLKQELKVEANL